MFIGMHWINFRAGTWYIALQQNTIAYLPLSLNITMSALPTCVNIEGMDNPS